MTDSLSIDAVKARLRISFMAELPARLTQCHEHLQRLAPGEEARETLKSLHLAFHNLKGTSGSLDLLRICQAATLAERALHEALSDSHPVDERLLRCLRDQLHALEQLVITPCPTIHSTEGDTG
jgi:chemotaxis protein histidine kinase CheA